MDADLDTVAIALYARIDDTLKDRPDLVPRRPKIGIVPKLADAELLTLAVMQALLGHANETGWLRYAGKRRRRTARRPRIRGFRAPRMGAKPSGARKPRMGWSRVSFPDSPAARIH